MRFDLGRWREFGLGLLVGLSLSVAVLVWQNYRAKQEATAAAEKPRPDPRSAVPKSTEDAAANFEFYDRLQNIEVQVPDKIQPVSIERGPAPPTTAPGVYVIQAGSFRAEKDADRVRAQLQKLGIESVVQPVQIDQGEVFRVRIGPLSDLAEINRLRARLRASDFESAAFRVGD
jgi:cell division protein FtsN